MHNIYIYISIYEYLAFNQISGNQQFFILTFTRPIGKTSAPSGQGRAACTTLCQTSCGMPSCRPAALQFWMIIDHGSTFKAIMAYQHRKTIGK